MLHPMRPAALCALIAVTVVAPGCGKRLQSTIGPPNQPPAVRIERPSVSGGDGESVTARLHWTATDPDGRVDHYLVTRELAALDRESGWTAVTEREQTLGFRRAARSAAAASRPLRDDFEFFAVRAVDDRGAVSEPAAVALFDENVAPTVEITSPHPSRLLAATVPPDFPIHWTGSDPDGRRGLPAEYKYKLWKRGPEVPWQAWLIDPDSLRRQFAPAFAGWDSCDGGSTSLRLTGLTPNTEYLFAITALDRDGAYDPVFSLDKNVLLMSVGWAPGPRLTLFNETFYYQYAWGLPPDAVDSSQVVRIQASALRPLTVNWYGNAASGYRWALDIADVYDETPRRGRFDLAHWSAWDLATTSATLDQTGVHRLTGTHRLYVEARDRLERVSLGVVEFTLVNPVFDRDLLIVDDTRFNPDQIVSVSRPDTLRAPYGPWPTAAELDTFLFAVGGKPWRMTPPGCLSPQGIFHGYRFDTLGTRRDLADPTLPLEVLGRYRHIVWIVDGTGSAAALRYMSAMNRQSALATWVESGGKLWAVGGGFGNATSAAWNSMLNDSNQTRTYSSFGTLPDLGPGRFMYDLAHWQSEFKCFGPSFFRVNRAPFLQSGSLVGLLPVTLYPKQPASDPIWPFRTPGDFYVGNPLYSVRGLYLEYLSKPNRILDDWNPAPWCARDVSVLDTLMVATGDYLPPPGAHPEKDRIVNPVMTLYRGRDCGSVVFSGFDCWNWSRQHCVGLVDAVLQGAWQLQRDPGAGSAAAARPAPATNLPVSRPTGD